MITRLATLADIPLLVNHINSAYRGESSRAGWTTEADLLGGTRIDAESLEQIIADPQAGLHTFWDDDGSLLACVFLKAEPDHLYLGMLTVNPKIQNRGLGKMVLQHSENLAKYLQLPSVRMTVITARTELIAWYNRHGYEPTGEVHPWDDAVHIGKRKTEIAFMVLEKKMTED